MGVKFVGIEPSSSFDDEVPMCPHGPMLLFERDAGARKAGRQFYACSACRDRKRCGFFLWRDERLPEEKARQWRERVTLQTPPTAAHRDRARRLVEEGASYCLDCSRLVLTSDVTSHQSHETRPVSPADWRRPSEVLRPLSCSRAEAQYLFSPETAAALEAVLRAAGVSRVLCCGAPRLHERLTAARLHSLMLDCDTRYEEFWPPERLCIYNMFNHHMFSAAGWDVYREFVRRDGGEGLAVFLDPPFGGRMEALALTVQKIRSESSGDAAEPGRVPVFLVLPYFNEPDVLGSMSDMHMTDLRVEYDNHDKYTSAGGGRKFGSPVRLFTSLPPERVQLPGPDYRLCQPCRRWVHTDNRHCHLCDSCTAKDGRPYRHCEPCGRCVKMSWQHCAACGRCALPDHPCPAAGCGPDRTVHRAKKRRRK